MRAVDRLIAEPAGDEERARRARRAGVVLGEHVAAAAARSQPQRAVSVDEERLRRRVVARQAVALVEVIDAAGRDHVDAVAGAEPQPALAVLAEEVHLPGREAVVRSDVREIDDAAPVVVEARRAQRLGVRGAQPTVGARDQVARRRRAQPGGLAEDVPGAVVEHDHAARRGGRPQLIADHRERAEVRDVAQPRDRDRHERSGDRARQAVQADAGRDPQIALGPDREGEDLAIGAIGVADRGRAARLVDVHQVRWRAADEHATVRQGRDAAHRAALGARRAGPAAGGRTRQAAIGAGPQRTLAVAPVGRDALAGQPARGVVVLDQAAAAELEQARRAEPDVAVAIDEQRPGGRRRHARGTADDAPAVVLAVGDAVVGADQDVAARADRHRGRRPGRVEPGREAVVQVDRARRAGRQEPHVARRPDPQRALAVAQHALEAIAAEPDVADAAPHAVAGAEHDVGAVAHHQAVGVGPQRADRRGHGAGPAGGRCEGAVGALDVQPGAVGADPQRAGVARHGQDRNRRQPARGRAREPRAVAAHQAVAAADADPAVGRDADDGHQARRQAFDDREPREALAVEAVHAVLGTDPQESVAVLGDAGHHQVAQTRRAGEHADRHLAGRNVLAAVGAHRAGDRGDAQRHRAAQQNAPRLRAGHDD